MVHQLAAFLTQLLRGLASPWILVSRLKRPRHETDVKILEEGVNRHLAVNRHSAVNRNSAGTRLSRVGGRWVAQLLRSEERREERCEERMWSDGAHGGW